jgi:hypothetical protein
MSKNYSNDGVRINGSYRFKYGKLRKPGQYYFNELPNGGDCRGGGIAEFPKGCTG